MWFNKASLIWLVTPIYLLQCCASKKNNLVYGYVIVGGGTCGLVVANRLSELSDVSVFVMEAGTSVLKNSNVTDVNNFGT